MPSYYGENTLQWKARNFPESVYPLREHQHLTKLLQTLVGDAGVGQLHKYQTVARLSESLGGTQYSELDYFFGTFLNLPRTSSEIYQGDPFTDQLTTEQWNEVEVKDAQYRERIRLFLHALLFGGTQRGLAFAAEAATGIPCQVFEVWRYIDDDGGLPGNPGRLTSPSPHRIVTGKQ